jgi:hypothetical protein
MKFKLILPAVAVMLLAQFAPQAAWSWDCYRYGYVSPREARAIWRAEHAGYVAPVAPYGYAPYGPPCYYHRGILSTAARAIF